MNKSIHPSFSMSSQGTYSGHTSGFLLSQQWVLTPGMFGLLAFITGWQWTAPMVVIFALCLCVSQLLPVFLERHTRNSHPECSSSSHCGDRFGWFLGEMGWHWGPSTLRSILGIGDQAACSYTIYFIISLLYLAFILQTFNVQLCRVKNRASH